MRSKCHETVLCSICKGYDHPSALHKDYGISLVAKKTHEGEKLPVVSSSCTQICGKPFNTSKSCAKIVKAIVYPQQKRDLARYIYCIIDDQSSNTLTTSKLFDCFHEYGPDHLYTLKSCSGESINSGRKACGYMIQSCDQSQMFRLPDIIECDKIPQNRNEIPSPEVVASYPHLSDIMEYIPTIDDDVSIALLIGCDLIDTHIVLDQRVGTPLAQRLPLGWLLIGNSWLGTVHKQTVVTVNKTSILANGRPTYLEPCDSSFHVKDDPVFKQTAYDECEGLSSEDQAFLDIMHSGFQMSESGKWTAPLPFRTCRPILHNNGEAAMKRAILFKSSLTHNPTKATHVCEFMQKILDRQHAKPVPETTRITEKWYLPLFSVYHPKKPNSVRVVFDSSAKYHGYSLNDVLLKGPPLYNSLLGILLRFRKEAVAVTADVEQMFHNFLVTTEHRYFLRFLWHEDNDNSKPLIDYHMNVHVFGNSPSPAVATYGLRKTVEKAETVVQDFIYRNFYVDDGLISCRTFEEAVDLLVRTQRTLHDNGKLRLHKFSSNNREVLDSFPQSELAKDLCNLDLCNDTLQMQRSLGLFWDIETDRFTFCTCKDKKAFTRRGILSVINGLYDPLGFAVPVVLKGTLLMKEILSSTNSLDWDDPVTEFLKNPWDVWVQSLAELEQVCIPRQYSDHS
ncbi:uncharacterized protein LOC130052854 [Ostrea edulis]|uniref:uncharacterized protein LOC130052854 n=1 Tax=Ostrea edulis TaxID=37623 RepID=UPI0024AF3F66|nr:uncharacterized protein LOC130052854 [Ostrea edulis]